MNNNEIRPLPGKLIDLVTDITNFEVEDGRDLIDLSEDDRIYSKFSYTLTSGNLEHDVRGVISISEEYKLKKAGINLEDYVKDHFFGCRKYEIYTCILSALYRPKND